MHEYYTMVQKVLFDGIPVTNERTGEKTLSLFGESASFLLRDFDDPVLPLVLGKRVSLHNILEELNWFLKGSTNVNPLQERGVRIWDEWADENGELGPIYGKQWVSWGGVNQIHQLIKSIKEDPSSRRHIVSAWNVGDLDKMALPPCHMMFQCYVRRGKYLDMQVYQRSADLFLGVPYNIASYAILTGALADVTGLEPGILRFVYGDVHLYANHEEQAKEMLDNVFQKGYSMDPVKCIYRGELKSGILQANVFTEPYRSGPFIKAPVAV